MAVRRLGQSGRWCQTLGWGSFAERLGQRDLPKWGSSGAGRVSGRPCHLVPMWGLLLSYEGRGKVLVFTVKAPPSAQFPSTQTAEGPAPGAVGQRAGLVAVVWVRPPVSHMGSSPKSCVSLPQLTPRLHHPSDLVMESLPASVSSSAKRVQK